MAQPEAPGSFLGDELVGVFEYVLGRFAARLEGLGDDEYRWEPVAGCWSVREVAPGLWAMDPVDGVEGAHAPDAEPFTTIAWRLSHLAGLVLGGFATWLCDHGAPYGTDQPVPGSADAARELLATNARRWVAGMRALDDDAWRAPIGQQFGEYGDSSTASLALHVLDEVVHHAAEVSVLRDLYRARG